MADIWLDHIFPARDPSAGKEWFGRSPHQEWFLVRHPKIKCPEG